jgi:hypothetical protein
MLKSTRQTVEKLWTVNRMTCNYGNYTHQCWKLAFEPIEWQDYRSLAALSMQNHGLDCNYGYRSGIRSPCRLGISISVIFVNPKASKAAGLKVGFHNPWEKNSHMLTQINPHLSYILIPALAWSLCLLHSLFGVTQTTKNQLLVGNFAHANLYREVWNLYLRAFVNIFFSAFELNASLPLIIICFSCLIKQLIGILISSMWPSEYDYEFSTDFS